MTDPNTPTTSTNPQDLIDQALGSVDTPGSTPTDTTEPTLPTPEPLSPPPATDPTVEQQKPEVEPTNAVPEPTAMPEPPKDVKPMGDDMPLAFASTATSDMPKVESPVSNISIEQITPAQVPPILTTPSTTDIGSAKPKKRSTKLVGMVVGIFLALSAFSFGGYWLYLTQYSQAAVIAGVFTDTADKDSCNGCLNGGYLVWRNGQCKVTGICGSADNNNDGVGDKDTANPNTDTTLNNETSCKGAAKGYTWCSSVDSNGKSYAFCETTGKGCNNAAIEKGYSIVYGSGVSTSPVAGGTSCNCGGAKTVYFTASNGVCDQLDAVNKKYTTDGYDYNKQGLCAVAGYFKSDGTYVYGKKLDRNGNEYDITQWFDSFKCDLNGCTVTNSSCSVVRYTCANRTNTACLDNEKILGTSGGFVGKCGTVEQIDVMCGGNYVQSRTKLNGECTEKDTPTPSTPTVTVTPTLMCTGLTHTPTTTPVIGDKLTFTCAGSSTPAGAVNLTYKFRYNLNNGAYVSMTNKTATTSELTIASCGTYKVQCQACGTINGVLTCDPTWTAATQ